MGWAQTDGDGFPKLDVSVKTNPPPKLVAATFTELLATKTGKEPTTSTESTSPSKPNSLFERNIR